MTRRCRTRGQYLVGAGWIVHAGWDLWHHRRNLVVPRPFPGRTHVWHQYTVRVTADARIDRDRVAEGLAARGIGTGTYYPRAVYDYECYRTHPRVVIEPMPRAEAAAREVLSLPVHPQLRERDLDRIIRAVREELDA